MGTFEGNSGGKFWEREFGNELRCETREREFGNSADFGNLR